MNEQDHKYVISIVSQRLARIKERQGGTLQDGEIQQILDKELDQDEYDVNRDNILAILEKNFATLIGIATSLHTGDRDDHPEAPWVSQRVAKEELTWAFWSRYRIHLLNEGWPEPVVSRLDQTTTEILDSMMSPDTDGTWDQRGLVVGHVQSGKTANYTGLICKAVDAGYKIVIVLAGMHNSLRTQTQIRLEEGFLGYRTIDEDINSREITGVGLLPIKIPQNVDTITTRGEHGDFKTAVAQNFGTNPGGNPLIFVVKKHTTILKNLYNWIISAAQIQGYGQDKIMNFPLLMIDDEADYASVDTKKQGYDDGDPDPEHDPTKINGRIRQILKSFDQSIYIGYTATPFANIFIPESAQASAYDNDLFPRSFIFNLPTPSNHIGPSKMFGLEADEEELPVFRTVVDHASSSSVTEREGWIPPLHNISHCPLYMGNNTIPPSLQEAIRSFIIATAARKARGQNHAHNSMLIHVTRFVSVQTRVKDQVEKEFFRIRDRIVYGDGDRDSVLVELRKLWETDFLPTSEKLSEPDCRALQWSEIQEHLTEAVHSIVIRTINGTSGDILEYARRTAAGQAFDVIAIGGDKLSRGLTLEGLTVSYFLRHSKMYDTLMQMGRWFGYRPGYLDLCRIYSTDSLHRWFRHISVASEELRQDFNRMVISGCTPRQFGHRVLCHPQLMVTSPTKMRHTESRLTSFDGCPAETTLFLLKPEVVDCNYKALNKLVSQLILDTEENDSKCHRTPDPDKYVWKNVSPDLITTFLGAYQGYSAARAHPKYLQEYIKKQVLRNKLINWTVFIGQGDGEDETLAPGCEIRKIIRARFKEESSSRDVYRVRRSGSQRDEFIDFDDKNELKEALDKSILIWEATDEARRTEFPPKEPRGPSIRYTRPPERGLICLYTIEPQGCQTPHPLVGFLISFPGDEDASPIQYRVNDVYQRLEEEGIWDE
jgi:hypothetical protein